MAETNRSYLMPFPRTAEQGTHKPICQQCHVNSRDVGVLSADGTFGDANPFVITPPDGWFVTANPRFQYFPHATLNATMLFDVDDNLALNCRSPFGLP